MKYFWHSMSPMGHWSPNGSNHMPASVGAEGKRTKMSPVITLSEEEGWLGDTAFSELVKLYPAPPIPGVEVFHRQPKVPPALTAPYGQSPPVENIFSNLFEVFWDQTIAPASVQKAAQARGELWTILGAHSRQMGYFYAVQTKLALPEALAFVETRHPGLVIMLSPVPFIGSADEVVTYLKHAFPTSGKFGEPQLNVIRVDR